MKNLIITGGLAATLLSLSAMQATAGDENLLILKQEGSANTIQVDQQNAIDSQVGGVELDSYTEAGGAQFNVLDVSTGALANPILQIGNDNSANITVEGQGGAVFLQQDNGGAPVGNTATVNLDSGTGGASLAAIAQGGFGNTATVDITGSFSQGAILQNGNNNIGTVTLGSDGAPVNNYNATLAQNGNDNESSLQVTGVSNGEYSYTLNGNNTISTVPVTILTNSASVSITQSTIVP